MATLHASSSDGLPTRPILQHLGAQPILNPANRDQGEARISCPSFGNSLTRCVWDLESSQLSADRLSCQPSGPSPIQFGSLAPTRDGPAVPVPARSQGSRAHPQACSAPSPGRAARSRGRGSFHSLPLSSLLSSAFRAGLTPGWAEPRAGWRLLRWTRRVAGPP